MNILFIDTETTGTDPKKHALLQIAAEFHKDGTCVEKFSENISQDYAHIDLGALRVNGVSASQVSSYGNPARTVLVKFVDYLLMLNKRYGSFVVCGHNVNFDIEFIKNALVNQGMDNVSALLPYRVLDTATIGLFLNSVGQINTDGKYSLLALLKALNVEVDKDSLHNAVTDVQVTAEVFYKMQQKLRS